MRLDNQVAVITGGGGGIGRATSLSFARAGASVIVTDVDYEAAKNVVDQIIAEEKHATAIQADVTNVKSVSKMVDTVLQQNHTIDILVTSAGVQSRYWVHELPLNEFRHMLDVNLLGSFLPCKAILPHMYQKKAGNIIFIASDSGKKGYAFASAYCASKFGVLGFMESLAEEAHSHKVRVNAVCPAGVQTKMPQNLVNPDGSSSDTSEWMLPEEVADVVLFLASDKSKAIHGQSINVYGGVSNPFY